MYLITGYYIKTKEITNMATLSQHFRVKALTHMKLKVLSEIEDMSVEDMMESGLTDGICPSICMNEGCDATYDYEPDSIDGWCDVCETNTVKSAIELVI